MRATTLLAYGITGLPLAAMGIPLFVYLPAFYSESVGIGMAAVGFALLAARIFDVISDPLVGVASDRFQIARGHRKGLMLIGLPLLLIGIGQLFRPAADAGAASLLGWSVCAYLGWTLIAIPYNAWGAELSDDYHERTRIAGSRELFVILGTTCAIAAPALAGIGGDPAATLDLMASLMWIVTPLALLTTLAVVPATPRPRSRTDWRPGWALMRRNAPLQRLLLAYVLNGIANGLPATLFLLFAGHVLGAREEAGLLLVIYFCAGILGLPLWLGLARRLGKHRAWALSMTLACASFVWVPLLGAGDVWQFGIICVFSGLSLGADLALPSSIQADVVELDTRLGGGNRAGLFFGLWGMATKLALALAVGIAFPLLDLAGFDAGRSNEAPALYTLALLYGAVPVAIKLMAIALVWRFPLDETVQQDLRTRDMNTNAEADEHEQNGVGAPVERVAYGRLHGYES